MQNPINLSKECSLFPLTVNVLPGGYLPLQIFEPRYLDMIKQCLNQESGFCVVLLQPNKHETTNKENYPYHYLIGTYVEIDDGLIVGNVIEIGEEEESVSLEPQYKNIWSMLKQISKHPEVKKLNLEINYNCSSSVIYNLASLLPLTPPERQGILESKSNISRLDHINQLVKKLGG